MKKATTNKKNPETTNTKTKTKQNKTNKNNQTKTMQNMRKEIKNNKKQGGPLHFTLIQKKNNNKLNRQEKRI